MVNVLEDLKQFAGFISLIPYYVTENVQLLDRCMLICMFCMSNSISHVAAGWLAIKFILYIKLII